MFTNICAMLDPGEHAAAIDALPMDVNAVLDAVRAVLAHDSCLFLYGIDARTVTSSNRQTLALSTRLHRLTTKSKRPLFEERPSNEREIGTCRDYVLMTCALLRLKGIAARVRCGFASYLTPDESDRLEDYWICEYHEAATAQWRRVDAQMDVRQSRHLAIGFDPADLPTNTFLDAKQAWHRYRSGETAPERFGHGDAVGAWFIRVNLVRDALALDDVFTSDWDTWRDVTQRALTLEDTVATQCDRIAEAIATLELGRDPNWTAPIPFWRS